MKNPITVLIPAAVTSVLAGLPAQSPPCFAANDLNTTVSNAIYSYSTAGPNVYAWQVTPATVTIAEAVRVFTRNTYQSSVGYFMTVEIWDEDPSAPGLPYTRLAGGTWQSSAIMSWQGANLDNAVVMQPTSNYWIVFTEPGWSTPPIEPGGATTLPSARYSSGAWTAITAAPLKFRIFCSQLDVQGAVPFGAACPSSAATVGTMFTNEEPMIGNADFRLEGSGFGANALTFMVLGMTPGFPTFLLPGTNGCY
ncbi:MAG: hypothetical protein KDC98_22995, partial [Planctomycetes bacterium]|nr:hypothetical protein [Planctomycetota bacterium]